MEIEFFTAKNGEISARFNSLSLHSAYSPSQESKRFIDNLTLPFAPQIIILVEPAVSYLINNIREKYPDVKLGIIRFSNNFDKYNSHADYVFYADGAVSLQTQLLNQLTEEELCSTFFVSWEPCAKAFPVQSRKTWQEIKTATEQARTILVTREYFEKKWLYNTCKFLSNNRKSFILKNKIDLPVVIVASGPSLNSKISFLRENQNKFFIICLSSAISCLIKNGIIPDICLSTDGGYWAGEHLKSLKHQNIPLAVSTEGYCPSCILEKNFIIPLSYEDGFTKSVINKASFITMTAKRNGTVSGTALDFALQYSSKSIFFFGLDLAASKGFQHTQPNEIELNNASKDFRLASSEKRMSNASINGHSLQIYENWFTQKKLYGRKVYRIIEEKEKHNSFNEIKDITLTEMVAISADFSNSNKEFCNFFSCIEQKVNKTDLFAYLEKELNTSAIQKQLFPLDFVALSHNTNDTIVIENRIQEKTDKIIKKIRKLFI